MQWLLKNSFYQFISGIINTDNSYKFIYFSLNIYIFVSSCTKNLIFITSQICMNNNTILFERAKFKEIKIR